MMWSWDMTVNVQDVLDKLAEALPCGSDAREAACKLVGELGELDRQPHVKVEAEAEINNLEAVDIIGDLLEALEDPHEYLKTTLHEYEGEQQIEELVQKLAERIRSGATVSSFWRDQVRQEIEFYCPELLH